MTNRRKSDHGTEWLRNTWRPLMAWSYFAACSFDFIIFPVFWSILQAIDSDGSVIKQWEPTTLQGGGLYHIAMGTILGITAWTRGAEKLADAYKGNQNGS